MNLHEAALEIIRNNGRAPRSIKRVNINGVRVWTRDHRAEHGCKGQRGYRVEGVTYASAWDIVSHDEAALAAANPTKGGGA